MARPPTRRASRAARARCGSRRRGRRHPQRRGRRPCPRPLRRRRWTSTDERRNELTRCSAMATAADEIGHCVPTDLGLGAGPLADLDRVAEHAREQRAGGLLGLGDAPRVADLTEDLALAHDHRVDAGQRPRRGGHRGVVVVGVEVVVELGGVGAGVLGEELAHVLDRGGGTACTGRRPRCGCRWRGPTTSARFVPRRQVVASALGSRPDGTDTRSRSSTGTVWWFRPTTIRDMSGAAPSPRRDVRRGSVRACRNPGRVANRHPRWNSRQHAALPELPTVCRASVAHSGTHLGPHVVLQPGGEGRAAPAGADRDDDVALTHDRGQRETSSWRGRRPS